MSSNTPDHPDTPIHTDEESQRHLALVLTSTNPTTDGSNTGPNAQRLQSIKNTPIFSRTLKEALKVFETNDPTFPVYGCLGLRLATYSRGVEKANTHTPENLVYTNTNAPWSTFICGSQGAGKSHTLSCMLENALLADGDLGPNNNPLASVLFHYDRHAGQAAGQICEAAYLASKGIDVEVFVSPSNLWAMQILYHLPGLPAEKQPRVRPLLLHDEQINISSMRAMMNIDGSDGKAPLYMSVVNKILRDMAIDRKGAIGIDYERFKQDLARAQLTPSQSEHLNMRLQLLESFLHRSAIHLFKALAGKGFNPQAGSLTIVDLSCPFVTAGDACMLFSICLSLFLGSRTKHGLLIAVDEAHKFLNDTSEAQHFTEDLVQVIREQRHQAARVIIATQEPTLAPNLLDLCNVTVVHRFQSQAWYHTLQKHLAALSSRDENDEIFQRIVQLENGEALVFCPTAHLDVGEHSDIFTWRPLKSDYIKLKVRQRVTDDGGRSIMATDSLDQASHDMSSNQFSALKLS